MSETSLRDIIETLIAHMECTALNLDKGLSKSMQKLSAREIRNTLKEVKEILK